MKVILTQDVDSLGQKGEVVQVKGGYGRNYLIPRGLAVTANAGNVRRYQEESRQQSRKLEQVRKDAEAQARRLSEMEITIAKPVGEEERIFGTVTTQDIVDELERRQIEIDRRKISIDQDIRALGTYTAKIRLHPDHVAELSIKVVAESQVESA